MSGLHTSLVVTNSGHRKSFQAPVNPKIITVKIGALPSDPRRHLQASSEANTDDSAATDKYALGMKVAALTVGIASSPPNKFFTAAVAMAETQTMCICKIGLSQSQDACKREATQKRQKWFSLLHLSISRKKSGTLDKNSTLFDSR